MAEAHKHPYHLVDPSPWPFVGGVSALAMFGGAVLWIHGFAGPYISLAGFLGLLFTMFVWWRDVIREAEHDGFHNKVVQLGLRYGMTLFIASEVMFFAAFFWAFFDSALFGDGGVQVGEAAKMYAREAANGGQWPPAHIHVFDAWDLPLINTMILLLSGCTVTWAHHALKMGDRKGLVQGLTATVLLGMSFTGLQAIEYAQAPFSFAMLIEGGQKVTEEGAHIADGGIYSSAFFMATGFHGFHVIVGTIFLAVCLFRAVKGHFKPDHHFGFEAAAWYWHFVDVVWLFLFCFIYVVGSAGAPVAIH